jgi:hypothetical protein
MGGFQCPQSETRRPAAEKVGLEVGRDNGDAVGEAEVGLLMLGDTLGARYTVGLRDGGGAVGTGAVERWGSSVVSWWT